MKPVAQSKPAARGWHHQKAFTLVEVMIGVMVVGIMFVSLYVAVSQGFGVIQLARENLRATQILQEKMETLRLYNWDQLNTPGFVPGTFSEPFYAVSSNDTGGLTYRGFMLITNAYLPGTTYGNDLRLVVAGVQWTSGNVVRRRQMRTFASAYGLQNYVY